MFFKGTTNTSRPSDFYQADKKILKVGLQHVEISAYKITKHGDEP